MRVVLLNKNIYDIKCLQKISKRKEQLIMNVELGISTFGETTPLEKTGKTISHDERIRNLIEEVELADQVGIDAYAIGEHHRKDFAVSAPEIIIAMAAAKQNKFIFQVPLLIYQRLIQFEFLNNMLQLMQWLLEELKLWLAVDHLLKLLTYLVMILIIMMNYLKKNWIC